MYWSTFLLLCSTLATTDTTIDTTLTNNTIVTWLVDDIYQVSLVEPGIIPNFRQIWKKPRPSPSSKWVLIPRIYQNFSILERERQGKKLTYEIT